MSHFHNKLLNELLSRSKKLCQGFCESPIRKETYRLSANIPIFIQLIIACFWEQKDQFFQAENVENGYKLSNQKQRIIRICELHMGNIVYIWRRIYGTNLIQCQSELKNLSQSKNLNELLFKWKIKIVKFPGIPQKQLYTRSIIIGLINLPMLESTNNIETNHYSIDSSGEASYAVSLSVTGRTAKYHNVDDWIENIQTNDIIKIEFKLNYNKGNIKFFKNDTFFIEYEAIDKEGEYRLYISTNSHFSECSLIDFECQIS